MPEQELPQKLGRYQIVRELGRGAMGVVYEGRDPNIGRRVAIKTARCDVLSGSGMANELMTRFLREAQAAGALNHPNIITIYDAGEENGVAYIAMEFLEGGDLRRLIDNRCSLALEDIAKMGADICEALAAAHDQGIIHRDVKPANVIVLPNGHVKVADFGIAHVSDSNLTQDGAMIGTPHYMSPEQFMGQKVDGRSDLFSVGIILYELLTGDKPFGGESVAAVMQRTLKSEPIPPSELNYAMPDALNQVVLKSLSKRPQQRYQNGRAMAAALRESVKPEPNPAILGLQAAQDTDTASTVISQPPSEELATMPGGPPAAKGADAATVLSVSPPPGVTESGVAAPQRKGFTKGMAAVVVVLALAAGGLGIYQAQHRHAVAPPSQGGQVTAPKAATASTVSIDVFYAEAPEVSADLQAISGTEDALARFTKAEGTDKTITRLPGARVKAIDSETKEEIGQGQTDDEGQIALNLRASPKSVTFEVSGSLPGHSMLPVTFDLNGPEKWSKAQFFVLYAKKQ